MQNNEFRDTIKRMQTLGLPCILDGVDYKLLTPQIIEYLQFRYFPRELLDRLPKDAVMAVIDWEAVRATENPCLRVHKGTHLIYSRPSEMEQSSLPLGHHASGSVGVCGRWNCRTVWNTLGAVHSKPVFCWSILSCPITCLLSPYWHLPTASACSP